MKKCFFWSKTLLVILTCDSTLLHKKNLFTSFEKGGQTLQHNSHSANLGNSHPDHVDKVCLHTNANPRQCLCCNFQFLYHSCAPLVVLVTSNMFTRLILYQTSSD